ncbi:MAG: glycosyltransferase family 39 protein [Candidatus Zixiibacteriota bacterium]
MISLKEWVKAHPLGAVLAAAIAVRLLAVIWSQGFIHSDDHFETVSVAWDWLTSGLSGDDGFLTWKHKGAETITRFPLYTLFLFGQMKLCQWLGIDTLGAMMYVIRFVHALLSLVPVWAAFQIARTVTGSVRWAVAAGLVMSFHFALPFLGMRNLIEVVGGGIWLAALVYLYRYHDDKRIFWLNVAGTLTGLAWMIRFQIAFAVLPVPLLLWWREQHIRPAAHYSGAVVATILLSGLADWWLLGGFARSTFTGLARNFGLQAHYHTIPLLYFVMLVLLLVPPISLVMPFLAFRRRFVREQALLVWSSVSFVVFHTLHPLQQERYVFPIVPAVIVMGILAVWHYLNRDRQTALLPQWLKLTAWASLAVNMALLFFFTFAYGHKGMIEPLRWLQDTAPDARVMFVQPEVKRWVPMEYGGKSLRPVYVREWESLRQWSPSQAGEPEFDYFVIYPKTDTRLPAYLDSLEIRFGPLELVEQIPPSYYDRTLHLLNPGHNDDFAAYVYCPAGGHQ